MRTVVDLFAGCGGMSLGLEQAGYTPVFVSELHPDARESYLQNRPDLPVARSMNQTGDILELTRNRAELEALASRLNTEHGDLDLVVGGPPCQGFSGIGHRRTFSDLEKIDIPSNHLYREMAKAVEASHPGLSFSRTFVGSCHPNGPRMGSPERSGAQFKRRSARFELEAVSSTS